ncbi:MAG TPA: hypothetical protein VHB23_17405 [Devosiaceae bacterium]|nr:hypothetical protein [Devosiaceae bacterium]
MAADEFDTVSARGISVTLDLEVGHIRRLAIESEGRILMPLHTAPWIDEPAIAGDEAIPPSLRRLSGDFFCAPFGESDVDPAPAHGWSANSPWRHVETRQVPGGVEALYRLERPILGAVVEKTFTVRDGHPFLYETHAFIGGTGNVPVANHAMTRFPAGGRLSFSPKAYVETPASAPEPDPKMGRSRLAYPQRSTDPTRMKLADGGTVDITRYPFAERHEDIAFLIEAPGHQLGWITAQRPDGRDMFISLKNPSEFPVTVLWFSNGGRDYAPWNSRHIGVLGMEEGRIFGTAGHRAGISPNPWTEEGIPTALTLNPEGRVEVRNVIGGLPLPAGAGPTTAVEAGEGRLGVMFEGGGRLEVPFDPTFLAGR